jgi:hypothetical protein
MSRLFEQMSTSVGLALADDVSSESVSVSVGADREFEQDIILPQIDEDQEVLVTQDRSSGFILLRICQRLPDT